MDIEIQTFIEGIKTPVKKLTVKELQQREEIWRALWSWLDDDAKFLILRVGSVVRIVRRDYKGMVGELGQVHFTPSEIEVAVFEKQYNYNDGNFYYERKVVKIPESAIMWKEFITEQELAEEVEQYAVESLEGEEMSSV